MKVIIVGGVAGGASCAARLRRLDERAEIIMVERGPFVSYANCGLPYHVGDVIEQEAKLLVATPQYLHDYLNIDARTQCEAVAVSPREKTVTLRNVVSGETAVHAYDHLVLAPGAVALRPDLPGIDLPGIFHVRTIPDAREIRSWIDMGAKKRAVVVGGGFIGIEMAENLVHRGFDVTIVEMLDHVLPAIDWEHASIVERRLEQHGVKLVLGDAVASFEKHGGALAVHTKSGRAFPADVVILALGVRPDTTLARAAGLEIGARGGIRVDEHMRTSDPHIFAVGDAVEVKDVITGEWTLVPLAGPASRQGRIVADVIAGRNASFRGVQGTSIIGLFDAAVGWTGASEKTLQRLKDTDYERVFLHPSSHATYYPGAKPVTMKVIFRKSNGRLLGAQIFGEASVDKYVNTMAAMIQMGGTVEDLEQSEMCYAPQFGSSKDPVNFAGMVASNTRRGDFAVLHWKDARGGFILDVREPHEFADGHVSEAVNVPLPQLRARLAELPHDRELFVVCKAGLRGYIATRILLQNGFRARVVTGGMLLLGWIDPAAIVKNS